METITLGMDILSVNNMKLGEKLTAGVLTHILMWATHCSKDENYKWTKTDVMIALLIKTEIRKFEHDRYIEQKNEKVRIPFHLT